MQNNNYFPANSHLKLPEKPNIYYSSSFGDFSSQAQENPISFPEEGNYTIKLQFFNNKNEVQHNITIEKKSPHLKRVLVYILLYLHLYLAVQA